MSFLTDAEALSRCGFTVHFPTTIIASESWRSPRVRYQDYLATILMRLVTNLISNCVGSHLVHTTSYPARLALSLDPETKGAALEEFGHDLAAWQAAKDRC